MKEMHIRRSELTLNEQLTIHKPKHSPARPLPRAMVMQQERTSSRPTTNLNRVVRKIDVSASISAHYWLESSLI